MSEIVILRGIRCVVCECITCGTVYTLSEVVYNNHTAEGGYHHCPNGHSQGWTKDGSERERLRRERDRLKQDAARLEDENREANARAIAQRERAVKAEAAHAKLKKRAAAGTCPCCQRTFSNMSTHMKRQHPTFVADTGANVVPIKISK